MKSCFLPATQQKENGEKVSKLNLKARLRFISMRHLDQERIRRFCVARSAKDVDRLLREIERANLWSLAERPFDLEGILAKWDEDGGLRWSTRAAPS